LDSSGSLSDFIAPVMDGFHGTTKYYYHVNAIISR